MSIIKERIPWNKGLVTPLGERFWDKVDKSGTNGCWIWRAHCNKGGYGTIDHKIASRVSWELLNGTIPAGFDVCHHCDNPPCVNPEHLFLGTASDNLKDSVRKGRLDHSGEKNSNVKLTYRLVQEIRNTDLPQRKLATLFGVSKGTIYYIKKNITWVKMPSEFSSY